MFAKRDIKSAPTGVKLVLVEMLALFVGLGLSHANKNAALGLRFS